MKYLFSFCVEKARGGGAGGKVKAMVERTDRGGGSCWVGVGVGVAGEMVSYRVVRRNTS